MKIPFVYTIEASFCGNVATSDNYLTEDYRNIGETLFNGVFLYLSKELCADGKLKAIMRPEQERHL